MELLPYEQFEELSKTFGSGRSIYLNLETLPNETTRQVLEALHLPLERGMSCEALTSLFGSSDAVDIYVSTHQTYEFTCGEKWVYSVFCTVEVERRKGLVAIDIRANNFGVSIAPVKIQ